MVKKRDFVIARIIPEEREKNMYLQSVKGKSLLPIEDSYFRFLRKK